MTNGQCPARILVVDDEESLRHALQRGLSRAGFAAQAVGDAKEGVEAFLATRFDAVITDIRLPDLSGLDLLAILTEVDPGIPVILMTGYGTLETALDAMRRGARDYVQKPFVVEEVVQTLQRALAPAEAVAEDRRLRASLERRLDPDAYARVEAILERLRRDGRVNGGEGGAPGKDPAPSGSEGSTFPVPVRDPQGRPLPMKEALRRFETAYLKDLLARTGGNVTAAARLAGISRPHLYKKIHSLEIDAHAFKAAWRRGRASHY